MKYKKAIMAVSYIGLVVGLFGLVYIGKLAASIYICLVGLATILLLVGGSDGSK